MSFRYAAGINKPGFNPLGAQTTTYLYNLYGWGSNNNGQLGLGNTTNYSSPKQVGALTAWSKTSCGRNFTLASKTDGTLWSWGHNNLGQLGLSDATNRSSPVQIGVLTNWSSISTGAQFSTSVKTDGSLWAWGNNINGQLGLSDTITRYSPVQIGSLTTWLNIASTKGNATLALLY